VTSGTHGLFLAGLHDTWTNSAGAALSSCAIVTVAPAKNLAWLHDRTPVILTKEQAHEWLSPVPFAQVRHLLAAKEQGLKWWPVTSELGRLSYQASDCARPVDLRDGAKDISSYFRPKPERPEADGQPAPPRVPSPAAPPSPTKRSIADYFQPSPKRAEQDL
jgi:hypothetical protein